MKMKTKALAAVVAMCAAGGANASIDIGSGNSEAFLSVWDPVAQVSYTRDLGVHFNDFLAGGTLATTSWLGGDTTDFANAFAASNSSDLHWNVAATNNSFATIATWGLMTTSNDSQASLQNGADYVSINSAMANASGYATTVDGGTNYAANNTSSVSGSSYNSVASAGNGTWNNNWGGVMGFTDDAGVGQSLNFYQLGTYGSNGQFADLLAGTFSLAANGDLSYSVGGVPTVPVPPALWLLGSAVVGLVGVSRRKREAAEEGLMA